MSSQGITCPRRLFINVTLKTREPWEEFSPISLGRFHLKYGQYQGSCLLIHSNVCIIKQFVIMEELEINERY